MLDITTPMMQKRLAPLRGLPRTLCILCDRSRNLHSAVDHPYLTPAQLAQLIEVLPRSLKKGDLVVDDTHAGKYTTLLVLR